MGRKRQRYRREEWTFVSEVKARLDEVLAAIRERRFRPWHASDLLSAARTSGERRRAAAKVAELVALGYEGRNLVVRLEAGKRGKRCSRARCGSQT